MYLSLYKSMMKVLLFIQVQRIMSVVWEHWDSKQTQVVFCLDIVLQFDTSNENLKTFQRNKKCQGIGRQKLIICE